MTRDPYAWIDPWAEIKRADAYQEITEAAYRTYGGWVAPTDPGAYIPISAPTPNHSVPIWLLAIIMLGIAFGVPMIVGWVW